MDAEAKDCIDSSIFMGLLTKTIGFSFSEPGWLAEAH